MRIIIAVMIIICLAALLSTAQCACQVGCNCGIPGCNCGETGQCGSSEPSAPPTCEASDACHEAYYDSSLGACVEYPISCEASDACHEAGCDPAIGCVEYPISCTASDACHTASCDPSKGCVKTPISCAASDSCHTASCDPTKGCVEYPINCKASDACHTASCDPTKGCVETPISCEASDACHTASCDPSTGECVETPITCTPSDQCHTSSCDPSTGECIQAQIKCSNNSGSGTGVGLPGPLGLISASITLGAPPAPSISSVPVIKSESYGSTKPPVGDGQKIPLPIDPHIPSGSKCRGACGEDCPSGCIPQPDLKICVEDRSGKFHEYWKYTGIIECGSAEGCRTHDKCYDDCASDPSPMTCRRVCDKDCIDKYGVEPCANWTLGIGDFDSYLLYSNPPVSDVGFQAGPCSAQ